MPSLKPLVFRISRQLKDNDRTSEIKSENLYWTHDIILNNSDKLQDFSQAVFLSNKKDNDPCPNHMTSMRTQKENSHKALKDDINLSSYIIESTF